MSKVKITCDSTCDLSRALYERYPISVVPMQVVMGNRRYRDGVDVEPKDLFSYVEEAGKLSVTSAISVGEYEGFSRNFVADGYEVVHIDLPSGLSSCYRMHASQHRK